MAERNYTVLRYECNMLVDVPDPFGIRSSDRHSPGFLFCLRYC